MSYFHPIHKNVETCQKLAFTHPIVVLKSGLKTNWKKKLDRVNRPSQLQSGEEFTDQRSSHFKLCIAINFKSLWKKVCPKL